MKIDSVKKFEITPNQYELFRFTIPRPTTVHIRMIATAPVNLLLLNNEDRAQYESGRYQTHTYTAAWGRKSDLEAAVKVNSGTWYLAVEGSTERSTGRVELYQ
jgi:hypothetical protein